MPEPQRFRKKPIVIEAMQYRGGMNSRDEIVAWSGRAVLEEEGWLLVATLEGPMRAHPGDWIIRGVAGEFYPCKPEIFEQTYEAVGEPALRESG